MAATLTEPTVLAAAEDTLYPGLDDDFVAMLLIHPE
jgi:hypothetical protein